MNASSAVTITNANNTLLTSIDGAVGGTSVADLVDSIWDEAISGHTATGSVGKTLSDASQFASNAETQGTVNRNYLETHLINGVDIDTVSGVSVNGPDDFKATVPSAADVADAVWDETLADHLAAGSTGAKLNVTSDFNNALETVSVSIIGGDAVTGLDDLKADVSGLSTFDPTVQEVNVGSVNGFAVSGPDSFKADISGLSTFDPSSDAVLIDNTNWGDLLAYAVGGGQAAGTVGKALEDINSNISAIASDSSTAAAQASSAATDAATAATQATTAASQSTTAATKSTEAAGDAAIAAAGVGTVGGASVNEIVSKVWQFSIGGEGAASRLTAASDGEFMKDATEVDIDGLTVEQALRVAASVLAGKLLGADTAQIQIRDLTDTKNRVVADVTADGNRTTVTVDGT